MFHAAIEHSFLPYISFVKLYMKDPNCTLNAQNQYVLLGLKALVSGMKTLVQGNVNQ